MSDTAVAALPPMGMITVRGDLGAIGEAVARETGCAVPDRRMASQGQGRAVLWMSPDELLVLCDHEEAETLARQLTEALSDVFATLTVVSDARQTFEIAGPEAEAVLASLMPVDFARLAPTEVRRTRMAQIPAAIWRHGDGYRLMCFRSVARYAEDLLRNAADAGERGA